MKNYKICEDNTGELLYRRIYLLIRKNRWGRPSIGAACGLAGGMLSIVLGALLWAIIPQLAPSVFASFLNILDIVFFALPLPLLALGAACLDRLEKQSPLFPLHTVSPPAPLVRLQRFRIRQPHNN